MQLNKANFHSFFSILKLKFLKLSYYGKLINAAYEQIIKTDCSNCYYYALEYSQTCVQLPPSGPQNCGHC